MPDSIALAGQRLPHRVEIARKNGDDVDAHLSPRRHPGSTGLRRIDLDDSVGQRHRGDDGTDERNQDFGAIPAWAQHRQQFAGAGVQYLATVPTSAPATVRTTKPSSWWS